MTTLQEVLAVILGAEAEAKRIVADSRDEAENYLKTTQERFSLERLNQMESAREQAKTIMDTALNAAKTESVQISNLGKEERDRIKKRFEENVDSVVNLMATEIAEYYISKRSL